MHPKKIVALMFLVACLLVGQGSAIASPLTYFAVSFDGTTLYSETNAPAYPFTQFTYTMRATSDTSILEFTFLQGSSYYNLDDVVVVPASAETTVYSPCDGVAGNLVSNCGFETGDFTGWTQFGDTTFDGVLTGDTYVIPNVSPNSGLYMANFGSTTNSGISQSISTTPGTLYDISFYLENDGCGGCTPDPTPEPAPAALFMTGLGGLGLLLVRRRR